MIKQSVLEYFMITERSPWNSKISLKSQAGLKKSLRYYQFTLNSQAVLGIALLASNLRVF